MEMQNRCTRSYTANLLGLLSTVLLLPVEKPWRHKTVVTAKGFTIDL